jgi:hypothetical protein
MNISSASAVDAWYSHFNQVGGDQHNVFVHNNYGVSSLGERPKLFLSNVDVEHSIFAVLEALDHASVPEARTISTHGIPHPAILEPAQTSFQDSPMQSYSVCSCNCATHNGPLTDPVRKVGPEYGGKMNCPVRTASTKFRIKFEHTVRNGDNATRSTVFHGGEHRQARARKLLTEQVGRILVPERSQ